MRTTDDIRVVPARPGDGEAILAVQRLAFAPAARRYAIPDLPPLTETLESVEESIEHDIVLVARDASGSLVGSIRGELRAGCAHIGRLTVRPDLQRRGLATRLLSEVEAAFPDAEAFELFTGNLNEPGMGLYAKFGYVEYARERVTDLLEVVHMRKTVRPRDGEGR